MKLLKAYNIRVFVQARKRMIMKGEIFNGEHLVNFYMASQPVRQRG